MYRCTCSCPALSCFDVSYDLLYSIGAPNLEGVLSCFDWRVAQNTLGPDVTSDTHSLAVNLFELATDSYLSSFTLFTPSGGLIDAPLDTCMSCDCLVVPRVTLSLMRPLIFLDLPNTHRGPHKYISLYAYHFDPTQQRCCHRGNGAHHQLERQYPPQRDQ